MCEPEFELNIDDVIIFSLCNCNFARTIGPKLLVIKIKVACGKKLIISRSLPSLAYIIFLL